MDTTGLRLPQATGTGLRLRLPIATGTGLRLRLPIATGTGRLPQATGTGRLRAGLCVNRGLFPVAPDSVIRTAF